MPYVVLQPVYKIPDFYGPYTERLQSIQQSHLLQCPDRVTEPLPHIRDIPGSNRGPDKLLRLFVVFLDPTKWPEQRLTLGRGRFLPYCFQFIIC